MEFQTTEISNGKGATYSFTAPTRFKDLRFVASGAQGVVVRAKDSKTNEDVAIKKLQGIFTGKEDERMRRRAQLAYREFVLQTSLRHPNIIELKYAYTPQEKLSEFTDVYLVMELQHCNLGQVILNTGLIPHKPLSFIIYQIIAGVHHLHKCDITHRDLKPENIGFRNDVTVRILDFGLARRMVLGKWTTAYICTRPYRAPEVALNQTNYNKKVDVWSIGCIMAELILHKLLFRPKTSMELYRTIVDIVGSPSQAFIKRLDDKGRQIALATPPSRGKRFEDVFPDKNFGEVDPSYPAANNESARDLLKKMLTIDPEARASLDELVQHPYVSRWYKEEEWNQTQTPLRYNREFDEVEMQIDDWKKMLFIEVKGHQAMQE